MATSQNLMALMANYERDGVNALLPANMPDDLLTSLTIDFENSDETSLSAVMFAVLRILMHRDGESNILKVSVEKMHEALEYYQFELANEEVNRFTEIRTNRPTIDNILTTREIEISRT
jgi:hypothetical protein